VLLPRGPVDIKTLNEKGMSVFGKKNGYPIGPIVTMGYGQGNHTQHYHVEWIDKKAKDAKMMEKIELALQGKFVVYRGRFRLLPCKDDYPADINHGKLVHAPTNLDDVLVCESELTSPSSSDH